MIKSNPQDQVSQGCCGGTNEVFDCTAMMERLKNCCENSQPEDETSCCAEIIQGCCGTSEKQPR